MLSLFPSLLNYEYVAPLLLRLTLGAIFLFWSYRTYKDTTAVRGKTLGALEFAVGFFLVIGLYAQLAALVASIILILQLIKKHRTKSLFTDGVNYYFILFIISLSLLLIGPGVLSVDLPL